MILFLDFDNLLIDTRSWIKDGIVPLLVQKGIPEESIRSTSKLFAGAHGENKPQYTPRRHFDALKINPTKYPVFEQSVQEVITQIDQYLFSDTLVFLQQFQNEWLILLTFGDQNFQSSKVQSSGLKKFFQEICIIDSDKPDVIQKWMVNRNIQEKVYFLDDKASYFDKMTEFPNIYGIHVLRNTDRCSLAVSHHDVRDLREAAALIKRNH